MHFRIQSNNIPKTEFSMEFHSKDLTFGFPKQIKRWKKNRKLVIVWKTHHIEENHCEIQTKNELRAENTSVQDEANINIKWWENKLSFFDPRFSAFHELSAEYLFITYQKYKNERIAISWSEYRRISLEIDSSRIGNAFLRLVKITWIDHV